MIRLQLNAEPRWLDLGRGVRVRVRPLTAAVYHAAKSRARAEAAALYEHGAAIEDAGGTILDLPDLADEHMRSGLVEMLIARNLARYGIEAWEGVGLDDDTGVLHGAPVNPDTLRAFADQPGISERFLLTYLEPLISLAAEGNASGPAPNGTSAAGPSTAKTAKRKTRPARAAKRSPAQTPTRKAAKRAAVPTSKPN